jgi:hypothetical protein
MRAISPLTLPEQQDPTQRGHQCKHDEEEEAESLRDVPVVLNEGEHPDTAGEEHAK